MAFLKNLFGIKGTYNDEQLVRQAMKAITEDPLIDDASGLLVTSKKGVVTLDGIVSREQEKQRIEGVVRQAFTTVGLQHASLVNDLRLARR